MDVAYISFQFGMDCLLEYDEVFKKVFHSFKTKFPSSKKYEEQVEEKNRVLLKQFKNLLKELNVIKYAKGLQAFDKGLKINNFIVYFHQKLNKLIIKNIDQQNINEVVLSWLRKQV